MKFNLYSVHDLVANSYSAPFMLASDRLAERAFKDLVQDPTTQVSKNPSDYKLYIVGSYDDETGVILPQHGYLFSGASYRVNQ